MRLLAQNRQGSEWRSPGSSLTQARFFLEVVASGGQRSQRTKTGVQAGQGVGDEQELRQQRRVGSSPGKGR